MEQLTKEQIETIKGFQRNEITEHYIYTRLAKTIKDKENANILISIGEDELKHYHFWKSLTNVEIKPNRWKIFIYFWIIRLFGLTFGIRLMENGEDNANEAYLQFGKIIPEATKVAQDEDQHEQQLIDMIREGKLEYMGSVVLGLNDALVELTGALAGLTFALQNTRIIALAGLITGIAASFSMAASEYLSNKSEGNAEKALTASIYTGMAYIGTVIILVLPYLLLANYFLCLTLTILFAVLIIFLFNYYISVAKNLNFRKRFLEMLVISLGVALLSFGIGFVIRQFFGIEI